MTPKQERFVAEYLVDLNATQAAIRAGYGARCAYQVGHELLKKPEVAARLAEARAEAGKRLEISLDRVLLDAWAVLTADVRELVEVRVGACRHCHGIDHRRQRTEREHQAELARWLRSGKDEAEFNHEGGTGFDPRKPPAPDCPECFGEGVPREVLHDTSTLSPAAAMLYAGARRTRDGLSVLLRDKDAARETLMKHLGGYAKDNEQRRTPLAEALQGFMAQIHADESGKLQHMPAPLRAVRTRKTVT